MSSPLLDRKARARRLRDFLFFWISRSDADHESNESGDRSALETLSALEVNESKLSTHAIIIL